MSLIRSVFNFKVFWQNFRSAQGLLLVAMIIYQAGILINCFSLSRTPGLTRVVAFSEISGIISLCACFLLPIAACVTLFDFLFSKKKSDLVFSSPIPRKTLYWSNWAGGMIFLLINVLIASLMLHVTLLRNPQMIVENGVVIRFLVLWGLSMMMVYSFCCLAVSLTGNRFVQFVLVAVLTLLPGWFHYTFQTQFYNYDQLSQTEFSNSKATDTLTNPYSMRIVKDEGCTDTLPYIAFDQLTSSLSGMRQSFRVTDYNNHTTFSYSRCWIMLINTLAASALGCWAFIRRKVEVAETSFISEAAHEAVRIAAFVPIFYTLGMKDWTSALLYAGILLLLYHLYDYLARREFISLRKTLISFLAVVVIAALIRFPMRILVRREASRQIPIEEVSAVGIAPSSLAGTRQYGALLKLRLADPELIQLVFQCNAKNEYVEGSISMIVRFYQGQRYSDFYVNFSPDQIPPLEAILSANDQYQLLYRGFDPQWVYWIEANGTSSELDKSQIEALARHLQREQQQQSFSDLLRETKQIACRQSEDSYCFLSLALVSFENGERTEQNVDLLRYQSVFQLYSSFVNQQFLKSYNNDHVRFLDFYSMYDNQLEQIRQQSQLDYESFNLRLSEWLAENLPEQLQKAPLSSEEFMTLAYYDSQQQRQGTIFIEKNEKWQEFVSSLTQPE